MVGSQVESQRWTDCVELQSLLWSGISLIFNPDPNHHPANLLPKIYVYFEECFVAIHLLLSLR